MFNFQGILTAAAIGAAAGWVLKIGPGKGAAVGAIVNVAGPMIGVMVAGFMPKPPPVAPPTP